MLKATPLFFLILFAAVLAAGCSTSRDAATGAAAKAPHPLTGAWDYTIDTPQGIFRGVLVFAETGDQLTGTIASEEAPDQAAPLEELAFVDSKLSFSFETPDYGKLIANVTVAGDAFDGLMNVTQFGVDVPMKGTRKME